MTAYFYDHIKKKRHIDVDIRLLSLSKRRSDETQKLLCFARKNQLEIRCSCLPTPARMFVRLAFDYFTVVNHRKYGLHHEDCLLVKQLNNQPQPTTYNETDETINNHDFLNYGFYLHKKENTSQRSPNPSNNAISERYQSKPHRLLSLYELLMEKTFNHAFFQDKSQSHKKILFDFKKECENIKFGGESLADWVFYGANAYRQASKKLFFSSNTWNGAGRPHCFLFFISENVSVNKNLLDIDGSAFQLTKLITPTHIDKECFIAMSLSFNSSNKSVTPHTAFIQPIQSTSLAMPVESEFERDVATALMGTISAHSSKHLKWSFFKPIFNKNGSKKISTPNFIFQAKTHDGKLFYRRLLFIENELHPTYSMNHALLQSLNLYKGKDILKVNERDPDIISNLHANLNYLIINKENLLNNNFSKK